MLKACPLLGGVQGCIAPPKVPNLQKKSPAQIAVCELRKSEKLGILCIFGQRNGSKFREGSSFVRFAPSEVKKLQNFCKMPTFRKSGRDPLLKHLHPPQAKILGMGLVEASQMHRLRKQWGLRELSSLNILSGGLEYPLAPPPKKSYILKHLD